MDLPRRVFRKRTRSNRLVDAVPPSCRPLWRLLLSCTRCITPLVTVLHLKPSRPMPSQQPSHKGLLLASHNTFGRRPLHVETTRPARVNHQGCINHHPRHQIWVDNLSGISNGRSSREKIQGLDPEFFCGNLRSKEKKLYLIATICREPSPRVDTTGCLTSTTHV